ncbi:ABC transporter substrate-binding protein [Streptomyces sp. JV176]|uniref:ABC transporter substrate-binding protein n=1 Tax=Streptomyces sp. JV176 TaxID=858630 RepID=UPI002E75ADAB|nr:ABC transporter substrate-binding protein [Streptomyces sp. JV176]MEE1797650.1 ABC transporter substrate-binding protein [Streptomyces sp. JV176]
MRSLLPDDIQKSGRVVVGTNAPYPPFENFRSESDQEFVGLDIDLARAVGKVLGVRFDFRQQPFDGLVPGVKSGKYDLVMAGMVDIPEREKVIDFVNYGVLVPTLLTNKKKHLDLRTMMSLCGQRVGAQSGTTTIEDIRKNSRACTAAGKPATELQAYPVFSQSLLALSSGKVDAVVTNSALAGYTVKQQGDGPLEIAKKFDFGAKRDLLGIGVSKERAGLTKAIQKALESLRVSGDYRRVLDSYGMADYGLTEYPINGASKRRHA